MIDCFTTFDYKLVEEKGKKARRLFLRRRSALSEKSKWGERKASEACRTVWIALSEKKGGGRKARAEHVIR